jgi:hypothetical protein
MLSPEASRCEARDEAPLCSLVESLTLPSLDSCVCGLDAFSPAPPRLMRCDRTNKALRSWFGGFS